MWEDNYKEEVIMSFEDGWKLVSIQSPEELNNYCYFCDFSEVTPHKHHIIRRQDGGRDEIDNIIPLCANHHELIHRRIYVLAHNPKTGLYFLVHRKSREVTPPAKRQRRYFRKLPLSSIRASNNLITKGDLSSKAIVSIDKFEKVRSKKQKAILKEQKNKKETVQ